MGRNEVDHMMEQKIILITGATGGIGKHTALSLAKMGATVVITGRSLASGEAAVAEIKHASGNSKVDLLLGDLTSMKSIRALVEQFSARYQRLDVLINNAGTASPSRMLTEDGVETNFAVNVQAPYLLTTLLMDRLNASPSGRVITLMGGETPSVLRLDNLQGERSFDGLNSYSQSKLAMMALMVEYAARVQGGKVTINVCYPGQASTNMTRSVTPEMLPAPLRLVFPLFKLLTRFDNGVSAEKASRSSVYLAASPEVEGVNGKYFDTKSRPTEWPKTILDLKARQRVWETAEAIAKQAY